MNRLKYFNLKEQCHSDACPVSWGIFSNFPSELIAELYHSLSLLFVDYLKKKKTCYFLKAEYTTCFCLLSSSIIYGMRLHLKLPSCTLFLVLLPLWTKASTHIANQL